MRRKGRAASGCPCCHHLSAHASVLSLFSRFTQCPSPFKRGLRLFGIVFELASSPEPYICDSEFSFCVSFLTILYVGRTVKQCELNAKEKKRRKKKHTWIPVYFCRGQPWRHSLAKLSNEEIDWHFSSVWLTHSKTQKTTHQSTIYNWYSF